MCNIYDVLMMYTVYAGQIMVISISVTSNNYLFFFLLVKCSGSIHSFTQSTANCCYYQTVINIRFTPQIHHNIIKPFLLLLPHLPWSLVSHYSTFHFFLLSHTGSTEEGAHVPSGFLCRKMVTQSSHITINDKIFILFRSK